MKKFISKGEWFDKGAECELIAQYLWKYGTAINPEEKEWEAPQSCGIFSGLKDGQLDEECCQFDEFDIIEENDE